MSGPEIAFVRLTEIPLGQVVALLNEPRNGRHLPLAGERFTVETAQAWVAAKDGQWAEHGYGPWAVLVDGAFAGWGGFQREENGADFALVLQSRLLGPRGRRRPRRPESRLRGVRARDRADRVAVQPSAGSGGGPVRLRTRR